MFFYIVKEKQEVLIESFGQYQKSVKSPGLHLKAPWHRVRKVPLGLSQEPEEMSTKTKDDIFVTVPIKIAIQVMDAKKYHYDSVDDPVEQVKTRVMAAVKQLASQMDFAELFQARETISDRAREAVGPEIERLFGMRLVDVIIDEPKGSAELQKSYNDRKASENEAVARMNRAKAEKEASILQAEGRRETLRLEGEGIAAQRKAIFENYAEQFNQLASKGLTVEQVHQTILTAMANDTVRDAASKGNIIITTTNTGSQLADLQALGKSLKPLKPANDEGESVATPAHKGPKVG